MSRDYIPSSDDAFGAFAAQFTTAITGDPAGYGISTAQAGQLSTSAGDWTTNLADFKKAENGFHTAGTVKEETRTAYESVIRTLTQIIQHNPGVTNAMRDLAGVPIYKDTRTPAPVPSTTPTLQKVGTGLRAILELLFVDSATPTRRSKPDGVKYCEIREQIGGAVPTNPETMAFLAGETRTPYRAKFEPEDIGKTVYFALRWVNSVGDHGPWSGIFTEVVPG